LIRSASHRAVSSSKQELVERTRQCRQASRIYRQEQRAPSGL